MSIFSGLMSRSVGALTLVALSVQANGAELKASMALEAAIEILLGNPYGTTHDEVRRNIEQQEKVGADDPDCHTTAWKFVVSVPASENNPDGISGYLCLSPKDGTLLRAGLPYLD